MCIKGILNIRVRLLTTVRYDSAGFAVRRQEEKRKRGTLTENRYENEIAGRISSLLLRGPGEREKQRKRCEKWKGACTRIRAIKLLR